MQWLGFTRLWVVGVFTAAGTLLPLSALGQQGASGGAARARSWLSGDHHIHSRFSVGWDTTARPPKPILGGDAIYPIPTNAEMARKHGLSWMVATDHGGPNHSKVNLEMAYPELLQSRGSVSDLIQFYGMELDTPGAEHSSVIVPHTDHEHIDLYNIEHKFSRREPFPPEPSWNTEARMLEALRYMKAIPTPPLVIANHPSRSATAFGVYGLVSPRELRDWNDTAPQVAVGMEGAPGHQASALTREGAVDTAGFRGGYGNAPTLGGFDQMTARVGGFWDSMLGEGRRWWVTSTSDSHRNWREGGSDFWPGEYSKTYVLAEKSYDDILDGLRNGRVFVTTGDLISEMQVTASLPGAAAAAADIGGTLRVPAGTDVRVTIRVRDPGGTNHHGDNPAVARVDLIVGEILGPVIDRTFDQNSTTRVVRRFAPANWRREGEYLTMEHTLRNVHHPTYLRVRGTNTTQLEPAPDPKAEDPWSDLWFYSNPVFLEIPE
ncbi:MAG: phosphoesterase [Gemmatimonadetes bacterium]|nr:phosphoesterase [Gemmatimonadota bacterium]